MKISRKIALAVLTAAFLAAPAAAAVKVFACEPEWGALATEIGGDLVSVYAATTALQDPHRIEARPSLIARARSADLMVCTGSDLEVGWLPLLFTQAGNAKIQPGSPGYFEASQFVARIEIPKSVDRSMGDVHPGGNPHIHLDPRNIGKVAEALAARLAQIDSANASAYKARSAAFLTRWQAAIERWEREGARLKGVPVVVYHRDLSYFIHWMGLREAGSLEPRPGLPATVVTFPSELTRRTVVPLSAITKRVPSRSSAAWEMPRKRATAPAPST